MFQKTFILLISIPIFSCSSSDNETNSELVGKWKVTSLKIESAFDFNNDGTASTDLLNEVPCYDNDFLLFSEDGAVNVVNAFAQISAEVTSPTVFKHVYKCLTGVNRNTTWTRDGNTITIENGSNDLSGIISGNKITVNLQDFFALQKYDGTEKKTIKEDLILVYTKQ